MTMEPSLEQIGEWYEVASEMARAGKNLPYLFGQAVRLAYQAGADAELDACCEWVDEKPEDYGIDGSILYDARRPNPPSLKGQALHCMELLQHTGALSEDEHSVVVQALESLSDD